MSGAQEIQKFEKTFTKETFAAGEVVFREGDYADAAYVIHQGTVDICTRNPKGELIRLTTMHAGQVLGDLALFSDGKRTAHALTTQGCELIVIRPEQLRAILDNSDPFVRFWIEYLGQRVLDLSKRIDH